MGELDDALDAGGGDGEDVATELLRARPPVITIVGEGEELRYVRADLIDEALVAARQSADRVVREAAERMVREISR